ncbi:hypothetical protein, partial [Pseudomonas aeruginosa]|uniref:hypothetical protein n=1 Tax=Pseudomonas aeruginosa TaxID=287 RepID=UPI001AE422DA
MLARMAAGLGGGHPSQHTRAMFAGRSQEQAIWVAATVTLRVMEHLVCWLGWLPGLAAAIRASTR